MRYLLLVMVLLLALPCDAQMKVRGREWFDSQGLREYLEIADRIPGARSRLQARNRMLYHAVEDCQTCAWYRLMLRAAPGGCQIAGPGAVHFVVLYHGVPVEIDGLGLLIATDTKLNRWLDTRQGSARLTAGTWRALALLPPDYEGSEVLKVTVNEEMTR